MRKDNQNMVGEAFEGEGEINKIAEMTKGRDDSDLVEDNQWEEEIVITAVILYLKMSLMEWDSGTTNVRFVDLGIGMALKV